MDMIADNQARLLKDAFTRNEREIFERLRPIFSRVRVRILIVTDGSGAFDSATSFGLGRMIAELRSDPWWWVTFDITTAHRRNDAVYAATADLKNFRFDGGTSLDSFDQIWLIGVETDGAFPLQPGEIAAVTDYMNRGGGVFATGDHEDLGASLCADLPRINKMRRWRFGGVAGSPPPVSGALRHDTCREGVTAGYQFNDQSDNTPQKIIPTRYYNPWDFSAIRRNWRPHPVLCGRNGIIDVLPDHMHEGWIVVPSDSEIAANPSEWPGGVGPEVIADATVIAHTNTDGHGYVSGKRFGVLGAYDGHPQRVGRIVVDATWHHIFNINLLGFDMASSHYAKIRNYYWNVALWLSPSATQQALFNAAVYGLIWLQPINELSPKIDIIRLGFYGIDAIGRRASQCVATDWIIDRLPLKLREILRYRPIPPNPPDPPFRGLEFVREFVLGGAIREMMQVFSMERPPERAPDLKELDSLIQRGVYQGLTEMTRFESQAIEYSWKLLDVTKESLQEIG